MQKNNKKSSTKPENKVVIDVENNSKEIDLKQKEDKEETSNLIKSPNKIDKKKKFLQKPKVASSKNHKTKSDKDDKDSPSNHIKEALRHKMR